jgi:gluconate 2-dehydrogenase gamma chain
MSDNTTPEAKSTDPSRREILRNIALAVTAVAGGQLSLEAAQHLHQQVKEEKKNAGAYKPKLFNEREYKTLGRLAELIVPTDDVSGSAREAGAPEFIDLLCSQNKELASIYTGGLLWLDAQMEDRYSVSFLEAREDQQTAMLDLLVDAEKQEGERRAQGLTFEDIQRYQEFESYGIYRPSELSPGIRFFDWVRKMTVDAFYTSEMGFKDIGYKGNTVISKFEVPQEVIAYALKRSPFSST